MKLFRNINSPLGAPVSMGGGGGQVKKICFETSPEGSNWGDWTGQIVEGCSKGEGVQDLNALAPALVLILETDRVINFCFDLSEHDGRDVASKEWR